MRCCDKFISQILGEIRNMGNGRDAKTIFSTLNDMHANYPIDSTDIDSIFSTVGDIISDISKGRLAFTPKLLMPLSQEGESLGKAINSKFPPAIYGGENPQTIFSVFFDNPEKLSVNSAIHDIIETMSDLDKYGRGHKIYTNMPSLNFDDNWQGIKNNIVRDAIKTLLYRKFGFDISLETIKRPFIAESGALAFFNFSEISKDTLFSIHLHDQIAKNIDELVNDIDIMDIPAKIHEMACKSLEYIDGIYDELKQADALWMLDEVKGELERNINLINCSNSNKMEQFFNDLSKGKENFEVFREAVFPLYAREYINSLRKLKDCVSSSNNISSPEEVISAIDMLISSYTPIVGNINQLSEEKTPQNKI